MMRDDDITVNVAFAANQYVNEKKYWMNKLSGRLPRSSFPCDYKRNLSITAAAENQSHRVEFKITGELFSKLIRASNKSDSRLFMIIATGLVILLHKYTGNEDIIIGAPIEKQGIEGEFINTVLVLRNHVNADMAFRGLLMQMRQVIAEACENQNYPLETLMYDLNLQGDKEGDFPLSDTAVLLRNIHERRYLDHIDLNLIFSFLRTDECIIGEVEYKISLYKKETVGKIFKHFTHLLRQAFIDMNVDTKIVDIDVLTEEEKDRLVAGLNSTRVECRDPGTIYKEFETQVEKTPDRIAVKEVDSSREVSYRELNEKSNQLAGLLKKKGLERGMIAAIMGERTVEIVIGILAILKSGGGYLPLDAQNPDDRITFILEESNVHLFLSQKHIVDQRQDIFRKFHSGDILVLDDPGIYRGIAANLDIDVHTADMAYVIYTSGTTGKPKGVIIEHEALVNYICWAAKKYVKNEASDFPLYSSIAFDLTVTSIFTPLVTGNAMVVYGGWDKGNLIERILDDNRVGVLKLTPSHLKLIRDKQEENSQYSIKRFIVGGETLESQLARDIDDNFKGRVDIYNEYGPTEATVGCMLYKFNPWEDSSVSVSIGIPADNICIYLLDKHLNLVPAGAIGEIYISGVGLARGYLNRPELTAEKFLLVSFRHYRHDGVYIPERIYKTGDLARWLTDGSGHVEFLGRIDQQVKIRGFRIELQEIENRLLEHGQIKEALVIAKTDNSDDLYLCAYITANRDITVTGLREFLSKTLPDYMIPSYFTQIDKIPLTAGGKVDARLLPETKIRNENEYTAPGNHVEAVLEKMWADVLGIKQKDIGIDRNFFELGGHSLSATTLAAKIHKEFNLKILLTEIFKNPTIRGLGRHLAESRKKRFASIDPVEKREYYVLSSAQKRQYLLQQMDLALTNYNIGIVQSIEGNPDIKALEGTFKTLIDRHESLRTSFHLLADHPMQVIHDHAAFAVKYDTLDEEEAGERVNNFIRPFDLGTAPLLRVECVKIGEERYILMMDMHHIISDAVSMQIFIEDFTALYGGKELPPLRLQYKEFSEWQNREKQKEAAKNQRAYWLKQFEGEIPVINIPTDYPRPVTQSFEGGKISFRINKEQTRALNELALHRGATLFMVLLGISHVLLAKITGQEDVIVGTPTAGRKHENLSRIIGMFVNTLALRNFPAKEKTFREFLGDVIKRTLEAFENQDYQYEELVEEIVLERDVSRNPLIDVMFMFNNVQPSLETIPGLKLKPYKYTPDTSRFDLVLSARERENHLLFDFTYCIKLFKKETIETFGEYFKNIVSSILTDPDKKISGIEIISSGDKKRILYDFNNNRAVYPLDRTIHELFEEQATVNPGRVAVQFENNQLTYNQLNEDADRLALILRIKGVGPDTILGIMPERSLNMIVGIMAILKAGGAYLPLDSTWPEERLKFVLEDSETRLLLTDKQVERCPKADCELIHLKDRTYYGNKRDLKKINGPGDLAYIIFTSGSTGRPKGVEVTHRNVINLVYGLRDIIYRKYGENLKIAILAPIIFDASVKQVFCSLLQGFCLCIVPGDLGTDGEGLLKFYNKYKIDISDGTPHHLTLLTGGAPGIPKKLNVTHLIIGGEALSKRTARCVFDTFATDSLKITNVYGPTECSVDAAYYEITGENTDDYESIPIGKSIPNHRIFILDKNNKLQPPGIPGECCIAGKGLSRGYLNRPELTEEKFINNPFNEGDKLYKTGDLVKWLAGGNIEFLGRIDNQVKIRGYRIELGEIEHSLLHHDNVNDTVVNVIGNDDGDRYLCAYFVSTISLFAPELRAYLSGNLPNYMIPTYFVQVEKIPLTPNGKVDTKALPLPGIEAGEEYAAPEGMIEREILRIWSRVLGIDKHLIGRDTNFFGLGGHSLKAMLIISKIQKEFNVYISLLEFFRRPVIRGLAEYIMLAAPTRQGSIEPVERREYYSLSSQQLRLFFHQGTNPESTVYNTMTVVELEGNLRAAELEEILRKLINRHESLRTSFDMIEDHPVQRIHPEVEFAAEYYTLENGAVSMDHSKEIREILGRFARAFDLTQAPLLRVGLIRVEEKKCIFMLDIHHIITDGTSNAILTQELISLREGKEFAPLKIHYKDYSEGLNSRKQEVLKRQKEYWLKQFAGDLPVLDLPIDFERPSTQNFQGRMIDFEMSREHRKALKSLAYEEGVTLYTLLLTIYYILLSKLSHQEDIIIGTPTAGRTHAELESIIGFFVNTLGLRNFPQKEKTFKTFLKEVKEGTLEAFENQDYQFGDLVKQVLYDRDTSRNPLFDTMFVWHNIDVAETHMKGLDLRPYNYEIETSMFDLTLFGNETNHRLNFLFQYNTALFKEETIRRFGNYFREIVSSILENRDVELADIKLSHDFIASTSRKPTIEFSF